MFIFTEFIQLNKLELIRGRCIRDYWKEIDETITSIHSVLAPTEIDGIIAAIILRCLQRFDREVLIHWKKKVDPCWNSPEEDIPPENFTKVEEGKRILLIKLKNLEGKEKIKNAIHTLFAEQIESQFETFIGKFQMLKIDLPSFFPMLVKDFNGFSDFYLNSILPLDYHITNKRSNGLLYEKFREVILQLSEQNCAQLEQLQQDLLAVLENHYYKVSTWVLHGTVESSASNYEERVRKEIFDLMNLNAFSPPASSSLSESNAEIPDLTKLSLTPETFTLPSLFTPLPKDDECFRLLDSYFQGNLSRSLNSFQRFLYRSFDEVSVSEKKEDPSNNRSIASRCGFQAFLSHDWGEEGTNGKNHLKVKRIGEALRQKDLQIWIDDEQIVSELDQRITDGIDQSGSFLVFLTDNYVKKVSQGAFDDYCKREFRYAFNQLSDCRMVPIIMDSSMRDFKNWKGLIGLNLPPCLYHDFSVFSNLEDMKGESFDTAIDALANKIRMVISEFPRSF